MFNHTHLKQEMEPSEKDNRQSPITSSAGSVSTRRCDDNKKLMVGQGTSYDSGQMSEDSRAELQTDKQCVDEVAVTSHLATLRQLLKSGWCWRGCVSVYL